MSPTTEFFETLGRRGHEPMLETTTGALRFDLTNGKRKERWLVSINKGDINVSHANGPADCTVQAQKQFFDGVASGEVNAVAAILRGAMTAEGETALLVLMQRLFPAPPRAAQS